MQGRAWATEGSERDAIPDRRGFIAGSAALALGSSATDAVAASGISRDAFLWGVATAAHQIEGNNSNSDYWVLEHIPDTYFKEPSSDACDSFHPWREDIALVRGAGLNAYRFSVEWARVEPEPGQFSAEMFAHYRAICVSCREAGISPVVSFHHFTSPCWIAAIRGWENSDVADRYARYREVLAGAIGRPDRLGVHAQRAQRAGHLLCGGERQAVGEIARDPR